MKPDRWQQVSEIFQSALKRPTHERTSYLEEACGDDEGLRLQVNSLLAAHDLAEDDGFIDEDAIERASPLLTDSELKVGQLIARFTIVRQLGAGGMGEVYLAEDPILGRLVAIKVLRAEIAVDTHRIRRFALEAKAASALNHPNILTVYEIGTFESYRFIVTEFINGETLRERLSGKPITLSEGLEIALEVAAALTAAHDARIIHRDIKPENIMLRDDGLVKVLDFGLAKSTGPPNEAVESEAQTLAQIKTAPGMIMGTIAYMSPEQARGLQVDSRTDIFSFGAVLYEMLTGQQPFAGETVSDTLAAILKTEPKPLSAHGVTVPKELERIVGKALKKNTDDRYQDIRDLITELRNLKQDLELAVKLEESESPTPSANADSIASSHTTAPSLLNRIKMNRLSASAIFLVLLVGSAALLYFIRGVVSNRQTDKAAIDSIAVLPFVNTAQDPNADYLSDGITESLINSLTEMQELRVVARTTAFRYKGKEVDPQAVGRQLNVSAVLTGQVRQSGENVNIQVDLVDTTTGAQLWGQEYERKVSDMLSVKQTIAREATQKLRMKLSGAEQQNLVKSDTTSGEAYQFYLRGRYFWNKRNENEIKKAIEQFQQAVDRDPNYALGFVGLADSYIFLAEFGDSDPSEMLPKARTAVQRALQIDDSLAEAHASSAFIYRLSWRWVEAEEQFKRAVHLNPNYSTAHIWFSIYYRNRRQFDDALREIKKAQEVDPLSTVIDANVAYTYILKEDINSAVEQCKKSLELEPNYALTHELLGIAYLKQQRYEEATAEFEKAVELSKRANSRYLTSLAYGRAATGRRSEALAILKEIEAHYARQAATGQNLAGVYVALGDYDQAFHWLEKDFEHREMLLPEITWRFAFDGLRSDPRYLSLVSRMGL